MDDLRREQLRRHSGNALLAVVIVVLALAGLSAAFLEKTVRESASNSAADQRTRITYVAEAGITHAVAEIMAGGDGMIGSRDSPVSFSGGRYFVNTVDHKNGAYTVTSYAALNHERRALEVVLAPEDLPIFTKALFGDLDLGAKGTVFTDSYDSELGTYASQAKNYDETAGMYFAGEGGDLGSNRNIVLRGGVSVIGKATPGPGYAVKISGATVYVRGSTAAASKPSDLQPIEYSPPIAASGDFKHGAKTPVKFDAGIYRFEDFEADGQGAVVFSGDVTLYIDDLFSIKGNGNILLTPDANVSIYHNGKDFKLTGNGMVNATQRPTKFKLFSAATNVKITGNSEFYGAVYAPKATIDPAGTSAIYGSFVGRLVDINGTADFHYDDALAREAEVTRTRLVRASWRTVPPVDM